MKSANSNFTSIDIGSSKIAVIASNIDANANARVCYHSMYNCEGIKSGNITDFNDAENSIINAIYNLEQEISKTVKTVSISVSGLNAKSYYIFQKTNLKNSQVTRLEINNLIESAIKSFEIDDKEIIHYFPVEYAIDENNSIQNPVGMYAKTIGVRLHIITVDKSKLTNLITCFTNCHVEVDNVILGIYASGLSCLTEDEKVLGSILIDIGAKTTSMGVFLGGQLIYTSYIPLGAWHITSDIAKILSINMDAAEKIKVLYGAAYSTQMDKDLQIHLSKFDSSFNSDDDHIVNAEDLSQIISARVEEIVELLKKEYDKLGIDHLISRRVIITGGGAELRGIKEVFMSYFNKQVRIANPVSIAGFSSDQSSLPYSSAIGVIKNEINLKRKGKKDKFQSSNMFGKIISWIKESV